MLEGLVDKIAKSGWLDKLADPLARAASKATSARSVKNLLSGTWLGHPVHPVLTDLPIGLWTAAAVLDAVGEPGADRLIGLGCLAALPTAAAGLSDWSETQGVERRIGLVHALSNVVGLSLMTASWAARRNQRRGRGVALSCAGLGAVMAGGYLGGHLSFTQGVGVNRNAWEEGPAKWTEACPEGEVVEGKVKRVTVGGVAVMVAKVGARLHALADTCNHAGGPLHEGEIRDGCVVCPWHASTFRLEDGVVVRGPAARNQPLYEARVRKGTIEVRRPPSE